MKESPLQAQIRIAASQGNARLWRNNIGVAYDERGVPVRFGLANESAQVNSQIKSSDLIGITPRLITADDVGHLFGIFTSIECKHPGWAFRGTAREQAQLAWIDMIRQYGGIAKFVTCVEDLWT